MNYKVTIRYTNGDVSSEVYETREHAEEVVAACKSVDETFGMLSPGWNPEYTIEETEEEAGNLNVVRA